jgi:hypothetical protein
MVQPGFFIVHDAVRPPLTDGDYELVVSQSLSVDESSIDSITRSFRLVGPRYTMPPDQILSIFPPNNGVGSFDDRLPQIVLKRRTLPYERTMKPGEQQTDPWLALVVLADGEGQLTANQALDLTLPEQDDKDAPVRSVLSVSERVVQAVFPTIEDLPWLTHVREVDLSDTELALGDDDGWLAVVVSNRLPVPGPPAIQGGPLTPRHYTAFLVSLEGHEGDLPTTETLDAPTFTFVSSHVYSDLEISQARATASTAQTLPTQTAIDLTAIEATNAKPAAETVGGLGEVSASLTGRTIAATQPSHPIDAWSASPAVPTAPAAGTTSSAHGEVTGAAALRGLAIDPVFYGALDRTLEFTVLTSWSFTSQPEGDFGWLMQHLDVGMLGTPPKPPEPGATPPAPDPRPPLVVLDTGHTTLASTTRRGETSSIWYRGPFTPREILRPAVTDPTGVLAHAADQLRTVGPDGLENVSLAVAFEIGRMLVAAQPGVIAALLNWRRDGYAPARVGAILNSGASAIHQILATELAQHAPVFSAGVVAGVISAVGAQGGDRLGPVRPPVDPAPVKGVGDELAEAVAEGFGLDVQQVISILAAGQQNPATLAGIPAQLTQPTTGQVLGEVGLSDFVSARLGLVSQVHGILTDSLQRAPVLGIAHGLAATSAINEEAGDS